MEMCVYRDNSDIIVTDMLSIVTYHHTCLNQISPSLLSSGSTFPFFSALKNITFLIKSSNFSRFQLNTCFFEAEIYKNDV